MQLLLITWLVSQSNREKMDYRIEGKAILIDQLGVMRTETLFYDMSDNARREKYSTLYSMRKDNHYGCISAYQVYMSAIDEYDAAMRLVESMRHWKKALQSQVVRGRPCRSILRWIEGLARRQETEGHLSGQGSPV